MEATNARLSSTLIHRRLTARARSLPSGYTVTESRAIPSTLLLHQLRLALNSPPGQQQILISHHSRAAFNMQFDDDRARVTLDAAASCAESFPHAWLLHQHRL